MATDDEPDPDRTCPICGKVEPVSQDVINRALEDGLPDSWVCWECVMKKELSFPEPSEAGR